MNKILIILLTISALIGEAQQLVGKVIGVKDGDTIEVLIDGKPMKIRLFGIDCPEKKQAYGTKAKDFTASLSFGKTVSIQSKGTDKYRRMLGFVFLPDGRNLNHELVKAGYAWRYKYNKNNLLLMLEAQARNKRLGLWADAKPIPPWEFRHPKKT
ncbi:MAG TPA: thermonuclease family protein [Cytophagaceae bacterium]